MGVGEGLGEGGEEGTGEVIKFDDIMEVEMFTVVVGITV